MKYLLIMLFTFNAYTQIRVEIKKDNEATLQITHGTQEEIETRLKKIILRKKRFKGHWDKFPNTDSIFKRRKSTGGASGLIDDALEVVGLLEEDEYDYYVPDNFTVEPDLDYASDLETKKLKKDKKSQRQVRARAIKSTKKKWKNLSPRQKDDLIDYLMDNV